MYKCIENKPKTFLLKSGRSMVVPIQNSYSVYWVTGKNNIHVLDIKNNLSDPKSVGEGICKLLNKGEIVLNLR